MSNNFKLSQEDIEDAESTVHGIENVIQEIERCKQFKVGDYLIGRKVTIDIDNHLKVTNKVVKSPSYNTVEKFLVVYVSTNGIPFYKQLDINGRAMGYMTCCICGEGASLGIDNTSPWYMELDPDYADAIILDNKADFNPSEQKRHKANLYKDITKYNKANKINTYDDVELEKFLHSLKSGDIMYRSVKTFYTVQNVEYMSLGQARTKYPGVLGISPRHHKTTFVHVIDSKGKAKMLYSRSHEIMCTNLYKQKPRSYRELSDK